MSGKIPKALAVGKFDVTKDEFAAFVKDTRYDAGSRCYSYNKDKVGGSFGSFLARSWVCADGFSSGGLLELGRRAGVCEVA